MNNNLDNYPSLDSRRSGEYFFLGLWKYFEKINKSLSDDIYNAFEEIRYRNVCLTNRNKKLEDQINKHKKAVSFLTKVCYEKHGLDIKTDLDEFLS